MCHAPSSTTWVRSKAQALSEIFHVPAGDISGDVPMRLRKTLPRTVTLPHEQCIDVPHAVVRWSRGKKAYAPCTPTVDHITQITKASIRRRLHRTAHAPGADGVGLTVGDHEAIDEAHNPRGGRIACGRRRRPIVGRLDPGKNAGRYMGPRQRGILQAL